MRAISTGLWAAVWLWGCAPAPSGSTAGGGGGRGPMGGVPSTAYAARTSELGGGTLTLNADGTVAAISDPDRDQVVVMSLDTGAIKGRVILSRRTRPTRGAVDGQGNFAVALRGSGELLRVSSLNGGTLGRVAVCSEPVDVAWSAAEDAFQVACASGELVTVPLEGSAPVVSARLDPDVRDVVVTPDRTWVTTLRSAQVIPLGSDGAPGQAVELPSNPIGTSRFVPTVAWRARPLPDQGLVVAHQRSVEGDIAAIQAPDAGAVPAYYTNACTSPIVRSALSVLAPDGQVRASFEVPGALPVDLAVSPDGTRAAVVLAGSRQVAQVRLLSGVQPSGSCSPGGGGLPLAFEPIAVAFRPDGSLVVQSHHPPELVVYPPNGGEARHLPFHEAEPEDPAYLLFHDAVGGLACASCHPEGRDDGHTWTFTQGKVRTQSLAGGLSMTAPYHWNGKLGDLTALLDETFARRMGGAVPEPGVIDALEIWLDGIPPPGRFEPLDAEAAGRGAKLFLGAAGCSSCHSGSHLTNATTVDVGTGGAFQVPSLVGLKSRGPWMHDGCAARLADRFDPACGGARHGSTAGLEPGQLSDLVSYLESL